MSRLIRINPETWERLQHRAVPGRSADAVVRAALAQATLGEVTCGVCGAIAPFTQEVEETWHPAAYRGDDEVSPVCPNHAGHYDAAEHAFILDA